MEGSLNIALQMCSSVLADAATAEGHERPDRKSARSFPDLILVCPKSRSGAVCGREEWSKNNFSHLQLHLILQEEGWSYHPWGPRAAFPEQVPLFCRQPKDGSLPQIFFLAGLRGSAQETRRCGWHGPGELELPGCGQLLKAAVSLPGLREFRPWWFVPAEGTAPASSWQRGLDSLLAAHEPGCRYAPDPAAWVAPAASSHHARCPAQLLWEAVVGLGT